MIADKTRAAHYLADYINRIEEAQAVNDDFNVKYYRELLQTAEAEFNQHYGTSGLVDIKLAALKLLTE